MPHQVLLRQLTRRLRPGTLAGFWQGRYTLQPWNEVANSAYLQQPAPQAQSWDIGADFGFAAHSHITNPSTGLDTIYQKHVWSRLGTVEPPESSDTDGQAQAKAIAAAAAFATLQPAAAAAATQEDEKNDKHRGGSLGFPDTLEPAATPAAILPSLAETPLDNQPGEDTNVVTVGLSIGLSTIPEEPEEASLAASTALAPQAAHHVDAQLQNSHSCQALPVADAELDRAEAGSQATGATAFISQTLEIPVSVAAVEACRPGTTVPSLTGDLAAGSQVSAGKSSSLQLPAADALAGCSPEALMQHAERVVARQLAPLPVLTSLETCSPGKTAPHALLSAAMHAAHAVPSVQSGSSPRTPSIEHAKTGSVPTPQLRSSCRNAQPGMVGNLQGQIRPAAAIHSLSCTSTIPSTSSPVSRAVPAVPRPVNHIGFMSHPIPETAAGDAMLSRPSAAAAATRRSDDRILARSTGAGRRHGVQTAPPSQALDRRHVAAPSPAVHALRPTGNHLRPVLAALNLLLDADSIKVSGCVPGFVVARGEVCGRVVHVCHLAMDSIAPSSQPAACRALCSLMDAAILVGCPVVTIHGSCKQGDTPRHPPAGAAMAADLADWMPAVQRHMDASGVVPQVAVSLGQLSTVSSLLASTCDFNFSQPRSCHGHRDSEHPEEDSSSSGGGRLRCKQDLSEQDSSSIVCSSVEDALHRARQLLVTLPSSNHAPAPKVQCHDPPWRACSGLHVIQSPLDLCTRLVDAGLVAGSWAAAGTAVCFGRLDCSVVGFLAMPCNAFVPGAYSRCSLAQVVKAVRFCNAFNLPIVSLLLHRKGESVTGGATRVSDLANLIFAYSEAAVPKLAVLCGPEAVPAGQCIRSDATLMWPSSTCEQPRDPPEVRTMHGERESAMRCSIIRPENTRSALCSALRPLLESRVVAVPRRKHALLPKLC